MSITTILSSALAAISIKSDLSPPLHRPRRRNWRVDETVYVLDKSLYDWIDLVMSSSYAPYTGKQVECT